MFPFFFLSSFLLFMQNLMHILGLLTILVLLISLVLLLKMLYDNGLEMQAIQMRINAMTLVPNQLSIRSMIEPIGDRYMECDFDDGDLQDSSFRVSSYVTRSRKQPKRRLFRKKLNSSF